MNIVVCVKQVPDTEAKINISADKNNIETAGIKWVMNPYDEFAVEEAIKFARENNWNIYPHCSYARSVMNRMKDVEDILLKA